MCVRTLAQQFGDILVVGILGTLMVAGALAALVMLWTLIEDACLTVGRAVAFLRRRSR